MSVIAVVGGVVLYFGLRRFIDLHAVVRLPGWLKSGGRDFFQALVKTGLATSSNVTGALQSGRLQNYLLLLVLMAAAAGALALPAAGRRLGDGPAAPGRRQCRRVGGLDRHHPGHLRHHGPAPPAPHGPAAAGRRGPDGVHGVRLVLGARPGTDATAGGTGDRGADDAGAAVAAGQQPAGRSAAPGSAGATASSPAASAWA
jgi:hypothetical protein